MCVMLSFVLYSFYFFFLLFFISNHLQYNNRQERAGQDVTEPTRKGTAMRGRAGGQVGGKRRETGGLDFYG